MVVAFTVAAALALIFSAVAIAHRNPVINVLSLVLTFFCLAAIYAMVGMDFLAAVQLVVYSGAVLVLFLFVVMLLNLERVERLGVGRRGQAVLGVIVAVGLGALLVVGYSGGVSSAGGLLPGSEAGTAYPIGRALMTTHLFAFEFISLILVSALVGALVLAKKELR